MRALPATLLSALLLAGAGMDGSAQTIPDLLSGIQNGGGWITIPIEGGQGSLRTIALPTVGLTISGCAQVWGGHSGTWDISVRDIQGTGELDVVTPGGQEIPFSYTTGMFSQLTVDVEWSEARDTTLLLWVGLESAGSDRNACEPQYVDSGRERTRGPGAVLRREEGPA